MFIRLILKSLEHNYLSGNTAMFFMFINIFSKGKHLDFLK